MSDININLHSVFHECLDEHDRFEFLKAEVSNLSLAEQGKLIVEAFGSMQNYIDMQRMCVEVLDEDAILTIIN